MTTGRRLREVRTTIRQRLPAERCDEQISGRCGDAGRTRLRKVSRRLCRKPISSPRISDPLLGERDEPDRNRTPVARRGHSGYTAGRRAARRRCDDRPKLCRHDIHLTVRVHGPGERLVVAADRGRCRRRRDELPDSEHSRSRRPDRDQLGYHSWHEALDAPRRHRRHVVVQRGWHRWHQRRCARWRWELPQQGRWWRWRRVLRRLPRWSNISEHCARGRRWRRWCRVRPQWRECWQQRWLRKRRWRPNRQPAERSARRRGGLFIPWNRGEFRCHGVR